MRRWLFILFLGPFFSAAQKTSAETAVEARSVARQPNDTVAIGTFDAELLAREMFTASNFARKKSHRLRFDALSRLTLAAVEQAAFMATTLRVSHENVLNGLHQPDQRLQNAGLSVSAAAENVAMLPVGNRSYVSLAQALVDAWMNSPGHRANLLNPHLLFLGCAGRLARMPNGDVCVFAVQDFYRP